MRIKMETNGCIHGATAIAGCCWSLLFGLGSPLTLSYTVIGCLSLSFTWSMVRVRIGGITDQSEHSINNDQSKSLPIYRVKQGACPRFARAALAMLRR